MKIFSSEQEIKDKIVASMTTGSVLTLEYRLNQKEDAEAVASSLEGIKDPVFKDSFNKAVSNLKDGVHPDMLYGSAILVSSVMNANDDVFLPEELWAARATPVNTPFNEQHKERDIIGHIYAVRPIDSSGQVIAETDAVPEYFHLEVDFVMYKFIFASIAKDIEDGFSDRTRSVSMECFYRGFDYAMIKGDEMKIVERNDSTAFLSKSLRAFGGSGEYDGYRVGRVLRNFRFVGMGNVTVPANPDSKYTSVKKMDISKASNLNELQVGLYSHNDQPQQETYYFFTQGTIMEIKTLEQATQVIAELQAKIDQFDEQKQAAEKAALADQITKANSKIEELTKSLTENASALEVATKQAESLKTELDVASKELAAIKATELAQARLVEMKDAGIEVVDEKAELETLKTMSQETFAGIIKYAKNMKKSTKASDTVEDSAAALNSVKPVEDTEAASVAALSQATNDADNEVQNEVTKAAKAIAGALANRGRKPIK